MLTSGLRRHMHRSYTHVCKQDRAYPQLNIDNSESIKNTISSVSPMMVEYVVIKYGLVFILFSENIPQP